MADNALGTLFSNIADAIRTKTANLGTMKPNEFPDKILSIAQIIHESGGEYVPPDNGDSSLKINCGYFRTNTTTGVRMLSIEHGLGTVPDFVIVYGGGISSQFMANGYVKVPKFVCAYGFHSSFASQISPHLGAVNYSIGFLVTTEKGIDEDEEKVGFITNCDSEKFLVGYGEDRNDGYYEFEFNSDYYWIAMSGIGSAASGGGSMEGVHTVTFMSEDGQTELFKRPVADSDNCADPVERKYIDPPTKESTDAQTFAHDGWSSTPGGSADADILNAVKADKTVYAAFKPSPRYYTIRFLDGDTILHTVMAEYGSTPTYTAEKNGYGFGGWSPDVVAVTGDADYQAIWVEKISFANASWAQIAEVSNNGKAKDNFAIGDTKTFTFSTETLTCEIVGFDHDERPNGKGKAGISILVKTPPTSVQATFNDAQRGLPTSFTKYIPSDIVYYAKTVNKLYENGYDASGTVETGAMKFWIPSVQELNLAEKVSARFAIKELGSPYELFQTYTTTNLKDWRRYNSQNSLCNYMTRNFVTDHYGKSVYINSASYNTSQGISERDMLTDSGGVLTLFGFCI